MTTKVRFQSGKAYRDIAECYEGLAASPTLAVDIETSGLCPWRDRIAVISVAAMDGETVLVQHTAHEGIPPALIMLLRECPEWITHNGANFDLLFLAQELEGLPQKHWDTLVGEQVLAVSGRHDVSKKLGATMRRRLGVDAKMDIDHRTWMLPHLTDEQISYCAADVVHLHGIRQVQYREAAERELGEAMLKEQALTTRISRIILNGMPVDPKVLAEKRRQLIQEAAAATKRVTGTFPGMNLNSPKQVKEGIEGKVGLKLPNTQAVTLKAWQGAYPILEDILTAKAAAKRTGFYDDNWVSEYVINGSVHSRIWQLGANTTRMTQTDPNFQQIPRNMRSIVGNQEGRLVVWADYGQLEVRITAHYAQDRNLIEACAGPSIHAAMALNMLGVKEPNEDQLTVGKYGTFTLMFDGSWRSIKHSAAKGGVAITDAAAKEMENNFRSRFPQVNEMHIGARTRAKRRAYKVRLPWGHQRVLIGDMLSSQIICNTKVQGSAAIGLKEAIFEMDRQGLLPHIGGLVHDEVVAINVPEPYADEFKVTLEECMIVGMTRMLESTVKNDNYMKVPIIVKASSGPAWGK